MQSGTAKTHQWVLEFAPASEREVDPLMGWVSDRTHTRLGRRRPWMLGAAVLLAAAVVWAEHRGVVSEEECVQDAIDLLDEIRRRER